MPITALPGLPAPVDAILPVIFADAALTAPDTWPVACLFSGYVPTLAACFRTYPWPAAVPPAEVDVLGVDVPPAVLPPLLLVTWTTRNTIAATPITAAARYRTIFTTLGRCAARTADRGPERDRDPPPGAARPSSPNPGPAGASKPCWP